MTNDGQPAPISASDQTSSASDQTSFRPFRRVRAHVWQHGADFVSLGLLALVAGCWSLYAFRFGLHHNPDSGLYLYSGALGYLGSLLHATGSNYAPGFPWLIAAALTLCRIPGDAATLVQALSFLCVLWGSYFALRALRAAPLFSVCAALLVGLYDSTGYVFGMQLSEGPLTGALVVLVAVWNRWLTRRSVTGSVALLLLASVAPVIRYVAGVVPLVVAFFWALHVGAPGSTPLQRMLRFLGAAVLGMFPLAAYMTWNRMREGVVTSHPPARVGVADNLTDMLTTLLEPWLGLPGLFVLVALALMVAALRVKRSSESALRLAAPVFCAALALGYLASLVAGASLVSVDRLSQRLCAPGIALTMLTLAMAAATALQVLLEGGKQAWLRRLPAVVSLLALLVVAVNLKDLGEGALHALGAQRKSGSNSAFESGFRRSKSEKGLRAFYRAELGQHPDISVTLVEAAGSPGRIRRAWMMVAGVLANTPRSIAGIGALRLDLVDEAAARFRSADGAHSILFLHADLVDSGEITDLALPEDPRLTELIRATLARVVESARERGRREHWLLVAKQARWFVPTEYRLGGVEVLRAVDAGGYRAYLLKT